MCSITRISCSCTLICLSRKQLQIKNEGETQNPKCPASTLPVCCLTKHPDFIKPHNKRQDFKGADVSNEGKKVNDLGKQYKQRRRPLNSTWYEGGDASVHGLWGDSTLWRQGDQNRQKKVLRRKQSADGFKGQEEDRRER